MRIGVIYTSFHIDYLVLLPIMAPVQSRVLVHEEEPFSNDIATNLDTLARQLLKTTPYKFQLQAASAILQGQDVILDVATGAGKSPCSTLPLLPSLASEDPSGNKDISLVVSPLSALMIDQVCTMLLCA